MTQQCRICAEIKPVIVAIYDPNNAGLNLETKINTYLPIRVDRADTLPVKLCYDCCSILLAFHKLHENCREADKTLRHLLGSNDENCLNLCNAQSDVVTADGCLESPITIDDDNGIPRKVQITQAMVPTCNSTAEGAMQFQHNLPHTPSNTLTLLILPESGAIASIPVIPTDSDSRSVVITASQAGPQTISRAPLMVEGKIRCIPTAALTGGIKRTLPTPLHKKRPPGGNPSLEERKRRLLEEVEEDRRNNAGESAEPKCNIQKVANVVNQNLEVYNMTSYDTNPEDDKTLVPEASAIPEDLYPIEIKVEPITAEEYVETIHTKSDQTVELVECSLCKCMYYQADVNNHVKNCVATLQRSRVTSVAVDEPKYGISELIVKSEGDPDSDNAKSDATTPSELGKVNIYGDRYVCGLCNKECGGKTNFLKHRKTECQFFHFECPECGALFKQNNNLEHHWRLNCGAKYGNREENKCHVCGKVYVNKSYFEKHIKYHFVKRTLKCDLCPRVFKRIDHLRRHQQSRHGRPMPVAKSTRFICALCSAQFSSQYRFEMHELRHRGVTTCICEKCGRGFFSQSSLNSHRSRVANCDVRNPFAKSAQRKRNSAIYYKKLMNLPPKYPCTECTRAFRFPSLLKRHIQGFHRKELPFCCKFCDLRFNDGNALARHKVKEHTGYRLSCKVCQAGFANPSALKTHMLSHKAVEELECPICQKAFKYKGDMTRHYKQCGNEESAD